MKSFWLAVAAFVLSTAWWAWGFGSSVVHPAIALLGVVAAPVLAFAALLWLLRVTFSGRWRPWRWVILALIAIGFACLQLAMVTIGAQIAGTAGFRVPLEVLVSTGFSATLLGTGVLAWRVLRRASRAHAGALAVASVVLAMVTTPLLALTIVSPAIVPIASVVIAVAALLRSSRARLRA